HPVHLHRADWIQWISDDSVLPDPGLATGDYINITWSFRYVAGNTVRGDLFWITRLGLDFGTVGRYINYQWIGASSFELVPNTQYTVTECGLDRADNQRRSVLGTRRRHQLASLVNRLQHGARAFDDAKAGGSWERHTVLDSPRGGQRRGEYFAHVKRMEEPESAHDVDQRVRAAELVQVNLLFGQAVNLGLGACEAVDGIEGLRLDRIRRLRLLD